MWPILPLVVLSNVYFGRSPLLMGCAKKGRWVDYVLKGDTVRIVFQEKTALLFVLLIIKPLKCMQVSPQDEQ
jgi:hypothetical protein